MIKKFREITVGRIKLRLLLCPAAAELESQLDEAIAAGYRHEIGNAVSAYFWHRKYCPDCSREIVH